MENSKSCQSFCGETTKMHCNVCLLGWCCTLSVCLKCAFSWLCTCLWWFRASDKKRNLAQQKAEAQRRLYGHGSTKKLSAASSDWEKQRHTLERRREELVRHKHIIKPLHLVSTLLFITKRFAKQSCASHFIQFHIFPPVIFRVKPQFSLLATDQLQWSIWDAKHLYKVVHLDCGQGSWVQNSFIFPPRLSKPV